MRYVVALVNGMQAILNMKFENVQELMQHVQIHGPLVPATDQKNVPIILNVEHAVFIRAIREGEVLPSGNIVMPMQTR